MTHNKIQADFKEQHQSKIYTQSLDSLNNKYSLDCPYMEKAHAAVGDPFCNVYQTLKHFYTVMSIAATQSIDFRFLCFSYILEGSITTKTFDFDEIKYNLISAQHKWKKPGDPITDRN